MKNVGLIVFLAAAVAAAAPPDPGYNICRNPVRVFPGKATVDLTPLFEWWGRQPLVVTNRAAGDGDRTNNVPEDARPLSAWYRVRGTKVGVTGSSWVVEAAIYTSPTVRSTARVILNNPPAVEEARFNALMAQRAELEQQIANARRVYSANTNAEMRAQLTAEMYRRSLSKVASDGVIAFTRLAIEKDKAAAQALSQLEQLETARDGVAAQLQAIPSEGGIYEVDWFAVLLGRTKQGVPIFDLGLVSATPP